VQQAILSSLAFLNVCSIDGSDVKQAAEAQWDDFEDCIIYRAAQKTKADYILTRNTRDFEEDKIPAITPTELIAQIHEKFEFRDEG